MADVEIPTVLEALAADARRCAPVAAASVRRRGDRRRVAVRAMASGSALVVVSATAGTAYAVDHNPRGISVVTSASSDKHPKPAPVANPSPTATPAPIPTRHHLHHQLQRERARLALHRHRRQELHSRHQAGGVSGTRYTDRLKTLNAKIARDKARIHVTKQELRESR
jgi:hypothetical protein